MPDIPPEEEIKQIVGHEFPGGEYVVEHWENFLLTECTGAEMLPDAMVHPVVLFHMPILGAKTTIAEMFALGQATSDFSIGIESYNWELFEPMYEDVTYQVNARVIGADRINSNDNRLQDRIQFRFDITEKGRDIARSTVIWLYNRGTRSARQPDD